MPVLPRYCYGLPRLFKHFKTSGESRNCHGLAKDRQGFVTVSLGFFTDAPGLTIRDDPASKPGQWDLGLALTSRISKHVRCQDASLPSSTSDVTKQQTITKSVLISLY